MLELLANTRAQAKILHHSQERAAVGMSLHVNANKTRYMCFKRKRAIPTISGKLLKFVDKFTNLGTNISPIESDVNICLMKMWTANDMLSFFLKFDVSHKIKRDFLSITCDNTTVWKH